MTGNAKGLAPSEGLAWTCRRLRDASEAPATPKEEKMSQGQGLLSGVGTALRDALSFRKGAAAASTSEAAEREVTLEGEASELSLHATQYLTLQPHYI